jgi:hypothetical protein
MHLDSGAVGGNEIEWKFKRPHEVGGEAPSPQQSPVDWIGAWLATTSRWCFSIPSPFRKSREPYTSLKSIVFSGKVEPESGKFKENLLVYFSRHPRNEAEDLLRHKINMSWKIMNEIQMIFCCQPRHEGPGRRVLGGNSRCTVLWAPHAVVASLRPFSASFERLLKVDEPNVAG